MITATVGTKSSTYQLAFQPAKTIIPGTVDQIAVSSGYYTGDNIIVVGDSNLVAKNIKNGVTIFGVDGMAGMGGGTIVDEISKKIIERTITEINDDKLQVVKAFAFYGCSSLTTVSFPACTTINREAFYNCASLVSISFPICANIGSYAFQYCANLTSVLFPACVNIGVDAFYSCSNFAAASFPICTSISSYVFRNCYVFSSLTLGASSVCTLSNSNAFYSTPFAGYSSYFSGTPYIYVPASLISAYQIATNWVYFSSYFSAIEDKEV